MVTDVILHVVLAGRGDAFILEYKFNGAQKFVVIDGGPTKDIVSNADTSYPEYLRACLEKLLNGKTGAEVPAIIATHADEDHYGGLLKLFESSGNTSIVWSKTKFFIPHMKTDNGDTLSNIYAKIKQAVVKKLKQESFMGVNDILAPGLVKLYPQENASVLVYSDTSQQPAVIGKPLANMNTNSTSILMQTEPEANNRSAIFFTGDNSAANITPYVNGKHFAIYKVQHHGSMFDSTTGLSDESTIDEIVMNETAIFLVLAYKYNKRQIFWRSDIKIDMVVKMSNYIEKKTGLSKDGLEKYYNSLRKRHESFISQCLDGFNVIGVAHSTPDIDGMTLKDHEKLFQDLKEQTTNSWSLDHIPGAGVFIREIPEKEFIAAFNVGRIQRFYASFTADAYVISSSWIPSKHPAVEVLVGLALNLQGANKAPATLYLTEKASMSMQDLESHAQAVGSTKKQLFGGTKLAVYSLKNGSQTMTLNANLSLPSSQSRHNPNEVEKVEIK